MSGLIVAGLGNPGAAYSQNRHNAGFFIIDYLAEKLDISLKKPFFSGYMFGKKRLNGETLYLVKPYTFMNKSGSVLYSLFKRTGLGVDDLVVVCDNMDLQPGSCRLKQKGSSAGHNGLASIMEYAGTSGFKRLYFGIGRPVSGDDVISHVLGDPLPEELPYYRNAVKNGAEAILRLLSDNIEKVMNDLNRKETD